MRTYYGLANKDQLIGFVRRVCDVIGHGKNYRATTLLLETCAAETHLGTAKDKTLYGAGAGVPQIDEGTFDWLKGKYKDSDIARKLKDELNLELSAIQYRELDLSPLAALVFCRLRYWVVEDLIPASRFKRGQYWKKHYNSEAGAGSPEEYVERCESTNVDELINWLDEVK